MADHAIRHCILVPYKFHTLIAQNMKLINNLAFITKANKGNMTVLNKITAKVKLYKPGNLVRLAVSWQ
jgi:hypothetical protein